MDIGLIKQLLLKIYRETECDPSTPTFLYETDEQNYDECLVAKNKAVEHCNLTGYYPFPPKIIIIFNHHYGKANQFQILTANNQSLYHCSININTETKQNISSLLHKDQIHYSVFDQKLYQRAKEKYHTTVNEYKKKLFQDDKVTLTDVYNSNNFKSPNIWYSSNDCPFIAANMLQLATILLFPCGYRFSISFREGFGNKSQKKETKNLSLHYIAHFNRVYSEYGISQTQTSVRPHFRRPHIRHLWKNSGINRLDLPTNPLERLSIIQQNNVERVWVRESYPGFEDKQIAPSVWLQSAQDLKL